MHHFATVVIAAMATTTVSASTAQQKRNSFVKTMSKPIGSRRLTKDQTPSPDTLAKEMSGASKRAIELRKKVMEKAKRVPAEQRSLQSSGGDGTDDYYHTNGNWNNAFSFDATQYALSYHRCAAVKQFDASMAAEEDTTTVFTTKNFAVFRFCPVKTCEDNFYVEEEEGEQGEEASEEAEYQETMFDRLKAGGANGDACQSNYGEYMLDLDDYMSIMTEYHATRFEEYCDECETCLYKVYQAWMKAGYPNRRNLKEQSDSSFLDDLESEDFKNAHRELGYNKYNACVDYDVCQSYAKTCQAGLDDSLTQYFECTQVTKDNGQVGYLGPHCAEDGITITLGVYSDENCDDYIGNGVSVAGFLGYELEGYELSQYVTGSLVDVIDAESIQARKEKYLELYGEDYVDEDYIPYDNLCIPCSGEDDDICTNLYKLSARCDKHYRMYNSKTSSKAYAQALLEEDMSCDFIDSIVMGNYDESGYMNIDKMQDYTTQANSGMFTNNALWEQYGSQVTKPQAWGLSAALISCVALAGWAASLTRSLNKGSSWRPRKAMNLTGEEDAVTMQRRVSYVEPGVAPIDLNARHGSYYMS